MPLLGDIRHGNLRALIDSCATAAAFAERIGSSSVYVSQLVNRTEDSDTGRPREMGSRIARRIEKAFDKEPGWIDQQHPVEGSEAPPSQMAHGLSPVLVFDTLPRITWEWFMNNGSTDLPDSLFVLPVGSNALLPRWQANTEIVWSRQRAPQLGKPVLFKDQHGQHHVRVYRQSRAPGQWEAAALDPNFASFHSGPDGLTAVAVYKGELDPDE